VVRDNLSAHKGERVRELVESEGCELLYLAPYSPNLSPIEEAFSKISKVFSARRRAGADKSAGRGDG
jgi:transposase